MLRRNHHVGGTKQRVWPSGEYGKGLAVSSRGTTRRIGRTVGVRTCNRAIHCKSDLRTLTATNPLRLHDAR